MTSLKPGDVAPQFSLPANGGGKASLADYSGKKVVLYFYPKDNTPACTLEAQDFSSLADKFEAADTKIIGMSPDGAKKHDNFCRKHDLRIMLASDETTYVLQAYGVWAEKQMYGRKYMGVVRTTLLIGRDGRIAKVWPDVSVKGHAEDVLRATMALA